MRHARTRALPTVPTDPLEGPSRLTSLALALALSGGVSCTDRATSPGDDPATPTSSREPSAEDPGDQPTTPGQMFSPCEESSQCLPQEFCVFPSDESGYCTSACRAPDDPSGCDAPPGDQPATCFDIGLGDGRRVCAIDCAGATCPRGMRCEAVGTADGERSICF